MRFSRVSTISTASSSASAPPDRPVPAPRGTNGTPSAASRRTTATTSSRLPGSTTTPGTRRCVGNPSRAYVTRSGSAVRTWRAPTISLSAAASDSPSPPLPAAVTWRARSRGGARHARRPAPVGERLVRLDEGDAADVARIRYGIGVRRGVGRHVGDPEPPVTRETVLQQLAVARLEDVQWLGGPGKQDNRQRKNGKFPRHGY